MYELFFAVKYLIPRKNSLSTALISIISVFIISLVVWLVLVFLSVTSGMEKAWLEKLTSFNAPLRITPTARYFHSYFYQIDKFSHASNFSLKTLKEKITSSVNPYDVDKDTPLPTSFPAIDLHSNNLPINPVQELIDILKEKNVLYDPYEMSAALLRLQINRKTNSSVLSQMSYLISFCPNNPHYHKLEITTENLQDSFFVQDSATLDKIPVFLPKPLQKNGACIGDEGSLQFLTKSFGSVQEQSLPIYVLGFYDPGVFPVGSRALIVPYKISALINTSSSFFSTDGTPSSGFYVWPKKVLDVKKLKMHLQKALANKEIAPFWTITTFHDYEFSKELMQQFQSDRTLLTIIATIILIVACSNIISLLILLVNDKKKEIALLQAIGAPKKNIVFIFGLCGITMGLVSTMIGTITAIITLRHIDRLANFISSLQGHDLFHASFFGAHLPSELTTNALLFILLCTPLIALVAGIIPAWRASKISPSATLRSQ
ncbi:MAG: ABC transporter permease [Parachlamydiales bacterium]|nr:ABC transporter permease [Parachlamydiales bacterium]